MARCVWRDWSCAAAAALGLAVAMPSSADDAQPRLARAGEALGAARLHDAEGDRAADRYHLMDARLDHPVSWRVAQATPSPGTSESVEGKEAEPHQVSASELTLLRRVFAIEVFPGAT